MGSSPTSLVRKNIRRILKMPESDLKIIKNCSDDEKREYLHAMSKERLVEIIIRLTRK